MLGYGIKGRSQGLLNDYDAVSLIPWSPHRYISDRWSMHSRSGRPTMYNRRLMASLAERLVVPWTLGLR